MVEVFKTNVHTKKSAKFLVKQLSNVLSDHQINFDLEDCDKILRVEANRIQTQKIIELVTHASYTCNLLE